MKRKDIEVLLQEVRTAKKVLCELYPRVGGFDEPKSAGVVLRRLFKREEDMIGFLEIAEED